MLQCTRSTLLSIKVRCLLQNYAAKYKKYAALYKKYTAKYKKYADMYKK